MLRRIEKIAYIHTHPFHSRDGGSVFAANTARGFADLGVKVLLAAPFSKETDDEVFAQMGLSPHPDLCVKLLTKVKLEIGPTGASWAGPFRRAALRAVRRFRAECVICRDLKMARLLVGDRYPGLVVYEAHNVYGLGGEDRDAAFFPEKKLVMHRSRAPMENRIFRDVDGVIAMTKCLAELLLGTRPLSQRILHAGPACRPLADPPGTADRHHIAFVGELDPHEGVGNLVRIMDRLPREARLLVFGKGRHLSAVKEIARNVGVLDRIDFAGAVTPDRLPAHLARCRAGAVPLVDCFLNRCVTMPMKVFDYLASGVSPVVPDFPAFHDLFEDPSPVVYFKPEDDDSLAEAITALFRDDGIFRRRHLAALRQATLWTWKDRALKILSFAQDLPYREEREPGSFRRVAK